MGDDCVRSPLALALASALAVASALAAFAGCSSDGPAAARDEAPPTYAADIAPMVASNCVGCHQPGGVAPFSLVTYDDLQRYGAAARSAVADRRMPPWGVESSGACQTFRDAKWLSDAKIERFSRWVDLGMPRGDGAPATPPPPPPPTFEGTPLELSMASSYAPRPSAEHPQDDYRCFLLDGAADEERFVTGIEVLPGNESLVHHVLVAVTSDGESEGKAAALDAKTPEPGWSCFGGNASPGKAKLVGIWAPGSGYTRYPEGTGIKVGKNRRFAIQVHYNLASGSGEDLTRIRLSTAQSVVKEAVLAPLSADDFALAPGQASAEVTASFPLALLGQPLEVHGVLPHMHTRGTKLRYEARFGDEATCLGDVTRWNFHWQRLYFYDKPVTLTTSQAVHLRCEYDTRGERDLVKAGEGTGEEMCLVFSYVTSPSGGPLPIE